VEEWKARKSWLADTTAAQLHRNQYEQCGRELSRTERQGKRDGVAARLRDKGKPASIYPCWRCRPRLYFIHSAPREACRLSGEMADGPDWRAALGIEKQTGGGSGQSSSILMVDGIMGEGSSAPTPGHSR